jgi:hypothetical protein
MVGHMVNEIMSDDVAITGAKVYSCHQFLEFPAVVNLVIGDLVELRVALKAANQANSVGSGLFDFIM